MELYTYRVPVYQNGPKAKFKGVVGFGARLYVIEASSDKDACTVLSRMIGQGDPRPLKCAHSIKKFKTLLSREPEPWTSRLRKACIEFDIDGFNKEFYYKRNDTDPTIAPFKFTLDLVSPLDGIFLKLVATPMSKCGKIDNPITGVCVAPLGEFLVDGVLYPISSSLSGDDLVVRKKKDISVAGLRKFVLYILSRIERRKQELGGLIKIPVLGMFISKPYRKAIIKNLRVLGSYEILVTGTSADMKCIISVGKDVIKRKGRKLKLKRAPVSFRKFFEGMDLFIGIIEEE